MPTINSANTIRGAYGSPRRVAGAPSAGTSEIQTITFGGTPTGGTFKLAYAGQTTAAITWSATNSTLVANMDAALEALSTIGTNNITIAAGTLSSGIGGASATFGGNLAKLAVGLISVADNSLTGTSPTIVVTEATPGVTATQRGLPVGGEVVDTTNAKLYINTGTPTTPVFTVVGAQS